MEFRKTIDFPGYMAEMNSTLSKGKDPSSQMRVIQEYCNSKIVYIKFEMTQLKKTVNAQTPAEDEFTVIKQIQDLKAQQEVYKNLQRQLNTLNQLIKLVQVKPVPPPKISLSFDHNCTELMDLEKDLFNDRKKEVEKQNAD